MLVKPNKTKVVGTIRSIRPRPDGWGAEVEVEVAQNVSAADEDFLRPKSGSTMTLFSSQPETLQVGQQIRAEARLAAGPFGERAILESAEPWQGD